MFRHRLSESQKLIIGLIDDLTFEYRGKNVIYIESDHEETESGLFVNKRYLVINNQMAYSKSTDHPQLTHRQVLHLPTDHQQRTTDPPTTNNQPPTNRQVFYQPTDHRLTKSLPSTHGSPTHRPYYIDQQSFDSQI